MRGSSYISFPALPPRVAGSFVGWLARGCWLAAIVSATCVSVADGEDRNRDCNVIDLVLKRADGFQARLHPNRATLLSGELW